MRYSNTFFFVLVVMIQSCQSTVQKPAIGSNLLIGSWKFVADQELDDHNHVKNEDKNVSGLLMYTRDRKMSVQLLWSGRRAALLTDLIMEQDGKSYGLGLGNNTWTVDQTRKIIDTYDAYFGDYSVDWEKKIVTHTINGNLRPEKDRTVYKRSFELKGDTLLLKSADPDPNIRWQTMWIRNKE